MLEAEVRAVLCEMGEQELAPMVLRYFCDMNATEIGEVLEIPPATVRTRLHAARLRLAERLIEKGLDCE